MATLSAVYPAQSSSYVFASLDKAMDRVWMIITINGMHMNWNGIGMEWTGMVWAEECTHLFQYTQNVYVVCLSTHLQSIHVCMTKEHF